MGFYYHHFSYATFFQ